MLIVKNSNKSIDKLIKEYEERNGLTFPTSFKLFLEKYNGGKTPNTSIESKGISSDIRAFYGMGDVECSFSKIEYITKEGKVLLPIAEDSFGNVFALDLGEEDNIYFINHEKGNEISLVEKTFIGFLKKCKSKEISDLSKRTPEEREQILIKKGKAVNITDGLREMWRIEYEKYKNLQQEEVII